MTLVALWLPSALAMPATELVERLESGERVHVVDVRHTVAYQAAHIPGAMHVPLTALAERRLPPLGEVVVVGDGLDIATVQQAIALLNDKPGIQAEVLEGGFPAWEAAHGASTAKVGFTPRREVAEVTWDKLQASLDADRGELVIIDLRGEGPDLSTQGLDGVYVVRAPHDAEDGAIVRYILGNRERLRGRAAVLIDEGDGQAKRVAQRLQAAGVRRVGILVGGAKSLEAQGRIGEVKTVREVNP